MAEGRKQSALKVATNAFLPALKGLVDGVLPIGTLNEEYWRHYLGDAFPRSLMPYAVDNDYFQQRSREAQSRRGDLLPELDLDPSRPVILFASKLQRRKRCADLVEAYRTPVPRAGVEPHPYLVIVGDGEERAALESQAAESGLEGHPFLRLQKPSRSCRGSSTSPLSSFCLRGTSPGD